jgi:sugar lactone lactonase YvrE
MFDTTKTHYFTTNKTIGQQICRGFRSAAIVIATTLVVPAAEAASLGAHSLGDYESPGSHRLFNSNFLSNQVIHYDETTGTYLGVFGEANNADSGLASPEGLAFGADGNLYVSSFGSNEILRYNGVTGAFLGTFGEANNVDSGLTNPVGLRFGGDGNLYVSSFGSNEVLRYEGTTGAFLGVFGEASFDKSGLTNPDNLVFGANGNLYITSLFTSEVIQYDGTTGAFLGVFGDASKAGSGLDIAIGLRFGFDGNLYVSSYATDEILQYDGLTGKFLGVFASAANSPINGPVSLEFGPEGDLYVSSSNLLNQGDEELMESVLRFDGTTGVFKGVVLDTSNTEGQLSIPTGLTFSPNTTVPEPNLSYGITVVAALTISGGFWGKQRKS